MLKQLLENKTDEEKLYIIFNKYPILTNIKLEYQILFFVLKENNLFKKAESILKKDPELSYYYSKEILRKRWNEAETFIKEDPYWAYLYARDVIGGRWIEAEENIAKSKNMSYFYLIDIANNRWKNPKRTDL